MCAARKTDGSGKSDREPAATGQKAAATKRAVTARKAVASKPAATAGNGAATKPASAKRKVAAATPAATMLRFVVHKHAATSLHFDFRLELDGVMKSWAVPKGPSLDSKVRRLAMEVEDHPISYNTFEGIIPQGQYGGGTVMLWDRGHYAASDGRIDSIRRGLKSGRLDIVLLGARLKGAFTLVRINRGTTRPQWLIFKRTDEFCDSGSDVAGSELTSIVSGRTMDEIAEGDEVWHSNRRARSD